MRILILGCLVAPYLPLSAQAGNSENPYAAAESASVARSALQRASAAMRQNDMATTRREVDRAASAWPMQIYYPATRARLAARAGDTSVVLDALTTIANLGLGLDLRADTSYSRYRQLPAFRELETRHDANTKPVVKSTVFATLSDSTLWPEGIDVDRRTGRLYVGSVRHRTIVERSADGSERELLARNAPGVGAILGIHVDAEHGVVWATTAGIPQMEAYTPADSVIAALLRVRISDGVIEKRWSLPAAARGHTLGDVTMGPDGTVYMTDSMDPSFYRLRPGEDALEHFTSPLFNSLQGMAPTPDGAAVYLADYSIGLLRFDVKTGAISRLADAPASTSLGCDGIAWHRGAIIAVQNGVAPARIMRFVLDATGTRITRSELLDRNSAVADEPTIGTIIGSSFVYVANSQWEKHDDAGNRKPSIPLTRPVLLSTPLP
ncbi:MAG: hypothetical protein V4550_18895 [Gemmatimonadota bacterium]